MNVEFKNINKHFGPVHANVDINLNIQSGSIQGILGENGAGKSTLMKILSGFIQPDSGGIYLDGKAVLIDSPADAIKYGIGMLHQDPLDFPPMRLIENFIVGQRGGLVPSYKETIKEFKELQSRFGFSLNPEAYVDTLTVGERQQLEILRLLWMGASALILDEPTTGISAQQKEKLFAALKILAEQGKTIIFVSHKLEDVEILCSKVAILRKGYLVGEVPSPYDTDQLVEMMFGKVISLGDRNTVAQNDVVFELRDLFVEHYPLKIENVNFQLRSGEVIGLAGMEGSGQDVLLRACVGLLRPVSGKVIVKGKDLTNKNYLEFMQNEVSFLPASRLEEGLVPGLSLAEHFTIAGEEKKGLFIDKEYFREKAENMIDEYHIIGRSDSTVESLSGGNQQRAALALLKKSLSIILLEHPTRGLDIESAIYMWGKLKERCLQGCSIFFISGDLEEILQYSDRILVFFSGHVSPPLDAATTSLEQLGQLIGGKGWDQVFEIKENYESNANT
ncbi:MAG: sugar ABC transporter ATP-binding protein [Chloroflexi bacterium HGW-Chloroflexi-3]|nr:MAG: sugar ABC transporter ATP-binding protein [Chloroflexi bacterium HGW-Chloroflexi-3]